VDCIGEEYSISSADTTFHYANPIDSVTGDSPLDESIMLYVVAVVNLIVYIYIVRYVKLVFVIHVGGTRCITSSTDNIMKILARITLNVEFIRTCIFIFWFYVWIQLRVWSILTLFSIFWNWSDLGRNAGTGRSPRQRSTRQSTVVRALKSVHVVHVGGTRNFQCRQQDENTWITAWMLNLRTCIFFKFHLRFKYKDEYDQY